MYCYCIVVLRSMSLLVKRFALVGYLCSERKKRRSAELTANTALEGFWLWERRVFGTSSF